MKGWDRLFRQLFSGSFIKVNLGVVGVVRHIRLKSRRVYGRVWRERIEGTGRSKVADLLKTSIKSR